MSKTDEVLNVAFFPLKGGHAATINGEIPQSLTVGETGFEVSGVRDRDWVLFDPNTKSFVSQRGWGSQGRKVCHPQDRQLATVRMDLRGNHLAITSGIGEFELPTAVAKVGKSAVLNIFGKELPVLEESKDASSYFSRLLEREVLLMRSDHERVRILPGRYQREGAYNQVAGADGMPFLLTSEASLIAVHTASAITPGVIPINRYRGNVVIEGSGLGAFGEDYIDGHTQFKIGNVGMWAVKACSRCPVPDINQDTGEIDGGALRILRGRAGTISTGENGVFFGQNLIHADLGKISVGDKVLVKSVASKPNITFRNIT